MKTELIIFVGIYLLISVGIGLYAATRVKNAKDYAMAGQSLPLYMVIATVFATWFGAEAVLGVSAKFAEKGLAGVVEDPFGASMCLILVGLFFAPKLYRMGLMTIGDYYRRRYDKRVELVVSVCIVISYLGWVAAQITALGLVFEMLSGGAISTDAGMAIGASIVLLYTLFGGMWSVALTDLFQMTIIVVGMLYIAYLLSGMAGGAVTVIEHAANADKFRFFPPMQTKEVLMFIGAAVTMMIGSIPQQDIFQRVMSAKTEKTAVVGSIAGGSLYFIFAFIPMFLVYSATLIDPKMTEELLKSDSQKILPTLILSHTPLFAQVMFFGALLSAIMSTASGTLLAPSITFTENIFKNFKPNMTDAQFLKTTRIVVVIFTACVTVFAMKSDAKIYEMVGNAYKVTLVGAFCPLVFGLYWKRASSFGATLSILAGLTVWIGLEITATEATLWPPQLAGLLAAFIGMLVGSYAIPNRSTHPDHFTPQIE